MRKRCGEAQQPVRVKPPQADSMLSVLLVIFRKYFLSARRESENTAWKVCSLPRGAAGPAATLPKHKGKMLLLQGRVCAGWCWDPYIEVIQ